MMFEKLPDTTQAFYDTIPLHAVSALRLNFYNDNFDTRRFNFDGKDHSLEFQASLHSSSFQWFFKHYQDLFLAYSHLTDEQSKRLYLYLIAFRLCGHLSVRLPVPFASKAAAYEEYRKLESSSSTPSALTVSGMFGRLIHYDFVFEGLRYVGDNLGLEYYLFRRQYFYSRDGINVAPTSGDCVIDGGACLGDTACVFSNAVGELGKVYSFDPAANHIEALEYNKRQFPIQNVHIMPFGLSDHNVMTEPVALEQYSPGFSVSKGKSVPLRSLDYLITKGVIDKPNFIKLDIEGSELAALKGARETIGRYKPKLAISLYHQPNDLFEIILFIKQHFPFYTCYLDHYTIHAEETVLYCKA
jgi:FkbM family methyltransferase